MFQRFRPEGVDAQNRIETHVSWPRKGAIHHNLDISKSNLSTGDNSQWWLWSVTRSAGLAAPLPWKSRSFNSQMRTIPSLPPVLAHVKRTFPKQQFLRIEILNFQASERSQNIDRNGISWECNEWNLNVKKEFEKKQMFKLRSTR